MTPLDIARAEALSPSKVLTYIHEGLGWTWVDSPKGFEWCGAFAAYCLRNSVNLKARFKFLASCYRLSTSPFSIQMSNLSPGDLLVIGNTKPWGSHICLVESVEGPLVTTIEGNTRTLTSRSGVLRRTRAIAETPERLCPITSLPLGPLGRFAYRPRDYFAESP